MFRRNIHTFFCAFNDVECNPTVLDTSDTANIIVSGLSGQSDDLINFPANALERTAHSYVNDTVECNFCNENLDFQDLDAVAVTECGHFSHVNCLETWLIHDTRCHICRQQLNDYLIATNPSKRYLFLKELLSSLRFQFEISCQHTPLGCYKPRLVRVDHEVDWYWSNNAIKQAYGPEISSQIQQANETGFPTLVTVMTQQCPAFYLVVPQANCQIKIELITSLQRRLKQQDASYGVVNDDGDFFVLPEASQDAVKAGFTNDQRIVVVNSKSDHTLTSSSYFQLKYMTVSGFQEQFGDLYCLHLGAGFQIKMKPEPDHNGLLKIRHITSD